MQRQVIEQPNNEKCSSLVNCNNIDTEHICRPIVKYDIKFHTLKRTVAQLIVYNRKV